MFSLDTFYYPIYKHLLLARHAYFCARDQLLTIVPQVTSCRCARHVYLFTSDRYLPQTVSLRCALTRPNSLATAGNIRLFMTVKDTKSVFVFLKL